MGLKYIVKVKVKNSTNDFGLGEGVIVAQEVEFPNRLKWETDSLIISKALYDIYTNNLKDCMEQVVEEIK